MVGKKSGHNGWLDIKHVTMDGWLKKNKSQLMVGNKIDYNGWLVKNLITMDGWLQIWSEWMVGSKLVTMDGW
jgi:hypothetical protein